jgi:hypothetical protein
MLVDIRKHKEDHPEASTVSSKRKRMLQGAAMAPLEAEKRLAHT